MAGGRELEKQLEDLKRTHEVEKGPFAKRTKHEYKLEDPMPYKAADLKSQRRIVELLEASRGLHVEVSSSKQKLVDQADQERKDFENKLLRPVCDDERSSKLSREAHEARMEVEKERTRAESAERERDRIATDLKRLEATAKQRSEEQEQQEKQAGVRGILSAELPLAGLRVVDGVDAFAGLSLQYILLGGQRPWATVWGSPHPNCFAVLL
ncbi:hypothetical protein AK812_SmicGene11706 [Symbiodinium microadriaticum]|uniref:Uncharacterized protein n=1 Tax=Symbiodinium microadriaticum TaxID=2951 RepID=A0A1Q9ECH8_SYMMI|nr:hypothetical protein AK812_SmicGene11706 [Symbiodinium microadriaticum]